MIRKLMIGILLEFPVWLRKNELPLTFPMALKIYVNGLKEEWGWWLEVEFGVGGSWVRSGLVVEIGVAAGPDKIFCCLQS